MTLSMHAIQVFCKEISILYITLPVNCMRHFFKQSLFSIATRTTPIVLKLYPNDCLLLVWDLQSCYVHLHKGHRLT